jgi:hypothetical protein
VSISSFKRHFISEYNTSPGKWLQTFAKKAKETLEEGVLKASDIYLDFDIITFQL